TVSAATIWAIAVGVGFASASDSSFLSKVLSMEPSRTVARVISSSDERVNSFGGAIGRLAALSIGVPDAEFTDSTSRTTLSTIEEGKLKRQADVSWLIWPFSCTT